MNNEVHTYSFYENHVKLSTVRMLFIASKQSLILIVTHLVLPIFNGIVKQLPIPKNQTSF